MPKFLTVVYTIHDVTAFEEERNRLMDKFKESENEPWAITAMSIDHEMNRLHWVEEALNANDMAAVDAAISHIDIGNIKSLDELGAREN